MMLCYTLECDKFVFKVFCSNLRGEMFVSSAESNVTPAIIMAE